MSDDDQDSEARAAGAEDGLRAQLLADYSTAVIHLALNRCRDTNRRTLLFAWVELLPNEVPPPIDDYEEAPRAGQRLGNKSQSHIHVRHAVVSSSWAVDWYLQCRAGRVAWPPDGDFTALPSAIPYLLDASAFSEEPRWPNAITHSEKTTALPFTSDWMTCPRVHHLIPAEPVDLGLLWSDDERDRAVAALGERLHFDLSRYPELWGSVHLVAPNPVYRALDVRLRSRPDGDSVLMRFRPRAGASLEGVTVRFQERVPWGPRESRVFTATTGTACLDFDHTLASVKEEISDAARGVLRVGDLQAAFLRTFHMSMHLARSDSVSSTKRQETFHVTRAGDPQVSLIGTPALVGPAEQRMSEAWYARQARSDAKTRGEQEWFRGQRLDAHRAVIQRIQRAHREVWLVDPYFGPDEVFFAESVGYSGVEVRILTAKNLEERRYRELQTKDPGWRAALWSELAARVEAARARLPHNQVHARVLGEKALHDRFLVSDEHVWSVGCSFSDFGERGSLLVALPDPASMLRFLNNLWAEARLLDVVAAQGGAT